MSLAVALQAVATPKRSTRVQVRRRAINLSLVVCGDRLKSSLYRDQEADPFGAVITA